MKFLNFTMYNVDKLGTMVKVSDKIAKNPPTGYKFLAQYGCLSNPFPEVELPPGTVVAASLIECDNPEALASVTLELMQAGATIHRVPIIETTPGSAKEVMEKLKL